MAIARRLFAKLGHQVFPSVRSYQWARFEVQALLVPVVNAVAPRYRRQRRQLSSQKSLSLNVGSGGCGRAGWVNVDAFAHADSSMLLDLRRRLPLSAGQVRRIYAEHVLEHLDFRDEVPGLLREFYRVLEAHGTLRIVVPDARRFVEAYLSGDRQSWLDLGWDLQCMPHDIHTPMHIVNHVFHQDGDHKFGYDYETLEWALRQAGFRQIHRQRFGTCIDAELALDQEHHAKYSLYVDASKG